MRADRILFDAHKALRADLPRRRASWLSRIVASLHVGDTSAGGPPCGYYCYTCWRAGWRGAK